jgi:hypothetical protein
MTPLDVLDGIGDSLTGKHAAMSREMTYGTVKTH